MSNRGLLVRRDGIHGGRITLIPYPTDRASDSVTANNAKLKRGGYPIFYVELQISELAGKQVEAFLVNKVECSNAIFITHFDTFLLYI